MKPYPQTLMNRRAKTFYVKTPEFHALDVVRHSSGRPLPQLPFPWLRRMDDVSAPAVLQLRKRRDVLEQLDVWSIGRAQYLHLGLPSFEGLVLATSPSAGRRYLDEVIPMLEADYGAQRRRDVSRFTGLWQEAFQIAFDLERRAGG